MPTSFSRTTPTTVFEYTYGYDDFGNWVSKNLTYTFSYKSLEETRTFVGSKYPNYRTFRSKNGYLPTLSCTDNYLRVKGRLMTQFSYKTINIYDANRTKVIAQARVIDKSREITGVYGPSSPFSFPSGLTNEAWSKVRRKLLDQDFNAPVFIAEGRKTIQMIFDTSTKLAKALSAFKRGRFDVVADTLGVKSRTGAADNWLAYKYGWMPMLNDIHGGAKTLADIQFKSRRDIRTFRARAKTENSYKNLTSSPRMQGILQYEASAWVTIRVRNPNTLVANKLGLLNPLTVAWELLPFSFVADWFVNIGDCLQELTAFNGVTVLTGGSSTSSSFVGTIWEANSYPYTMPLTSDMTLRAYSRAPGVQTLPRLQVKSDPLNLSKLTTSAALITQLAKSTNVIGHKRVANRNVSKVVGHHDYGPARD